jgi:hypothetical protein
MLQIIIYEFYCECAEIFKNMCGPALCTHTVALDHDPMLCGMARDHDSALCGDLLCIEFVSRSCAKLHSVGSWSLAMRHSAGSWSSLMLCSAFPTDALFGKEKTRSSSLIFCLTSSALKNIPNFLPKEL